MGPYRRVLGRQKPMSAKGAMLVATEDEKGRRISLAGRRTLKNASGLYSRP